MTTKCASYVRGRVIRVTRLDNCGRPIAGDDSVVVSKGFTSVGFTANTEEGEAISVQNAAGETCLREPGKPSFLGYNVEISFCQVDPDLFSMLTGQATVVDENGDVIGFTMDTAISPGDIRFALEVWAGAGSSSDACDNPNAQGSYGYFLLPLVQGGVVGDFEIANAEVTFTVTGAVTLDGNRWGLGLHAALLNGSGDPALLAEALLPTQHLLGVMTSLAPPTPQCGSRPYIDPTDPIPSSGGAVATDLSVTFTPVGLGASADWWIDYGDGTWEYLAGTTSATHEYAAAGTYTYVIYAGPGKISGTVAVTA